MGDHSEPGPLGAISGYGLPLKEALICGDNEVPWKVVRGVILAIQK